MENIKQKYSQMVKKASPDSPILKNCIKAFFVGGLICVIGQFITNFMLTSGFDEKTSGTLTSVILIAAASLLTGLGIYSKIGKFAGAGSIVPITGFSNSVTSPAVEFKQEGFILGVGAKIFIIAGPVIVYGLAASAVYGIILFAMQAA